MWLLGERGITSFSNVHIEPKLGLPKKRIFKTIVNPHGIVSSDWLTGDVNTPPRDELSSETKKALHALHDNDRANDVIDSILEEFTELPIEGPTRVHKWDHGTAVAWNALDRAWFRSPQADVSDLLPEARTIYNATLQQGAFSDHLTIRITSSPVNVKNSNNKVPHWGLRDPHFVTLLNKD